MEGAKPSDVLETYLCEIRKYPLLTREEEYSLGIKYKEEEKQLRYWHCIKNI